MNGHDRGAPDIPTDERERLEAVALAQALDRGTAAPELPDQALATAALLRHAVGGSELSAVREDAARVGARATGADLRGCVHPRRGDL